MYAILELQRATATVHLDDVNGLIDIYGDTNRNLARPSVVSALSNSSTGSIRVTWQGVAGAGYYLVYRRSVSIGDNYQVIASPIGSSLEHNDITVEQPSEYYYRIKACRSDPFLDKLVSSEAVPIPDLSTCSYDSVPILASIGINPNNRVNQPTSVRVTENDQALSVTWTRPALINNLEILGYRVHADERGNSRLRTSSNNTTAIGISELRD